MTSETKRASLAASPLSDEPRQKRETPRLQPLATNRHRASQLVETAMTSEDDFAPIWEESILLAEHEAVQASVDVGGWLSAALDDPNVCEQMKADINRWFSSGFLYLDSVRQLMQADREAVRAEQAAELAKFKALADTLAGALEDVWKEATAMRNSSKTVGHYHTDHKLNSVYHRTRYHAGKKIMEMLKPTRETLRQYKEANPMNHHDIRLIEIGQKEGYAKAVKEIAAWVREEANFCRVQGAKLTADEIEAKFDGKTDVAD